MLNIEWTIELRFVVAIALGFLIGLERESSGAATRSRVFAGVRTYTIISMYGFACAWLFQKQGIALAIPAGMLTLTAFTVVGYLAKLREGHVGWTSEISAALTFIVGSLSLLGDIWVPIALGVINTLLLSEKAELEAYVDRLNKTEFLAVLRLLLVTVIILPTLPDKGFTQFNLNPSHVWRVVVLVSSIGFVGYVLTKRFGPRYGLWLSGLLGGAVSSTAVSIAMGREAHRHPERGTEALRAAMLACAVMYLRILVLVWMLQPALIAWLWWRLCALTAIGLLMTLRMGPSNTNVDDRQPSPLQNPFEVRPALMFGAVFVILQVLTVLVQQNFGGSGVMVLSAVVGVTDIDPFILSIIQGGANAAPLILPAMLVAMMSNTLTKGAYVAVLSKTVRNQAAIRFGVWGLLHLVFIFMR